MSDIFISYASKDRQYTEVVAHALAQRGWSVWWDPEIVPGKRFDQVIEEQLAKARCIVVLWSASSVTSHWVITEAHEGIGRKILVPALIEDNVSIPLAFRIIEAAHLTNWLKQKGNVQDREFDQFVKAIVEHIGGPQGKQQGSSTQAPAGSAPTKEKLPWLRSGILVYLLGALIVLAVGIGVWNFLNNISVPAGEDDTQRKGEMVSVPAGSFFMGCNEEVDKECDSDEKPGRQVPVDAFSIDKTEVTVIAYKQCLTAGWCTAPGTGVFCNWNVNGREKHPINCVDWNQAKTYCQWAEKRLPTEAEWEKAARGMDGRKYPWGNTWDARKANVQGDEDGYEQTAPVGSFPSGSSPYGALDIAGNVYEWTAGRYDEQTYVLRGGSWNREAWYVRVAFRYGAEPDGRSVNLGFRCAQ